MFAPGMVGGLIRRLQRLVPFLVTGVANSVVGYSTIFFGLFIGLSGVMANVIGYAVALSCSFLLNRNYVFSVKGTISPIEVARFLCVFFIAYAVNVGVLITIQPMLGDRSIAAQVIAIAAYSCVFYPLYRLVVVRGAERTNRA